MKKFLGLFLALVLSLGIMSGCAKKSQGATQLTTVKVAYMPNFSGASSVVTGIKQGYFKKLGLDVQLVQFSTGPNEIAAMGSGSVDISETGYGGHTFCSKGQAEVISIDVTNSHADILFGNKTKGINTISDLKGKTIGTTLGTTGQIILDYALASAGMTESDVKVVSMDTSAAVTAMVGGNIDACSIWSPSTHTVEKQMGDKIVNLADDSTFKDKIQLPNSYVVTPTYASQHKDICVKFVQGIYKAMDYRNAHAKQAADWVATEIKQDPASIEQTTGDCNLWTAKQVYDMVNSGEITKIYEQVQDSFVQRNVITKAVDVNTFVSLDIMKAAYKANQ